MLKDRNGRLVSMDDPTVRAAAEHDPVAFLSQYPDGLLAVDEVQRVPQLILALKLIVDRTPRPGRFLLTGSANLLQLPPPRTALPGEPRASNCMDLARVSLPAIGSALSIG